MADLSDYCETKTRIVQAAGLVTIRGKPLRELSDDLWKDLRGRLPILICLCVQDTPENPCPCDGPIVWVPIGDIFDRERSARKSVDGSPIMEFRVPIDSKIILEQQIPMSAKAFDRTSNRIAKQAAPPSYGWVGAAFAAGLWIGSKLDDLFGSNEGGNDNVSDDWADILIDTFGPAPDWLQDIF